MTKYLIDSDTLTDIADAIREQTGDAGAIQVVQMANQIASIQGGGNMEYSTTEHEVGTWIDGAVIYERTFEITGTELEVSNTSWTSTTFTLSGVSQIVGVEIFGATNYQGSGLANLSGDTIQLQTTRNSKAYCKYFSLKYIKTSV